MMKVFLAAAALSSAQLNWNVDVLSQAKAHLAKPEIAAQAPAAVLGVPQSDKLWESGFTYKLDPDYDAKPSLRLVLNRDKDRVGIQLEACDLDGEGYGPCDSPVFPVPSLSIVGNEIRFGGELVARITRWSGIKLEKGFKLGYSVDKRVRDTGWNRIEERLVSVHLRRAAK